MGNAYKGMGLGFRVSAEVKAYRGRQLWDRRSTLSDFVGPGSEEPHSQRLQDPLT